MSQLQDNLNEILRQKNTYLLPENLKKDVTCLGVTGTYEGGGSGDVKLFDTVAHMQADPNPQEGDLAVVYREETNPSAYYFEGLYEYSNNSYNLVQSQLNAVQNKVYQGTFYGANGVQTGTLTTNISSVFTDTNAEVYAKIQTYYNSLTPRVLTDQDKTINTDIIIIPCKSDGTPLLDTSGVTNMSGAFRDCTSLTSVPLLDTSSVTTMTNMFKGCTSLTNNSLNNILAMCINATNITSNKTLAYIGLTQEQATTCQSLSNWSAFVTAGWTTGY